MLLAIEILGIISMCTLVFILIWGLIILSQISDQLKYKNYLLEKMNEHIFMISKNDKTPDSTVSICEEGSPEIKGCIKKGTF